MKFNKGPAHRGKGRPREFDREEALTTALRIFWEKGFAPASVAELCRCMGINPPSLYATFGNKTELFLEALRFYEKKFWEVPSRKFKEDPDIFSAVNNFFEDSAAILLAPDSPCGCMVVLAAVNISARESKIISAIHNIRMNTKKMFAERLKKAIKDGQIPADTDVPALAGALNTLLEGLSLQARDDIFQSELKAMAAHAVRLLPARK